MSSEQLYANGRIAVLSTKLFGADKFARLAECVALSEAVRVLVESNYGNGLTVNNPNDYEILLKAELDEVMGLLKELCFDKNAVRYLLCKYDYLNAKVLMKAKYMRVDGVANCFSNATFDPVQMQQAILDDDYSLFSQNMAIACDKVDMAFAQGDRSSHLLDLYLDQGMFADMKYFARRSSIPLIWQLYNWHVNTVNLMTIYRAKKAGFDADKYANLVVEGASITKQALLDLFNETIYSINELSDEYRSFYQLCKQENENLSSAEKEQLRYSYKLIEQHSDLLTIQPVLQYFYKKVEEIGKIRYVMIAIKSGVDKEKIKDKLK